MSVVKAPYGAECNGCGGCCADQLCPLAIAVFPGWRAPCPALEPSGEASVCGLIVDPMSYAPVRIAINGRAGLSGAAAILCGEGMGWDAIAPGEEVSEDARRAFRRKGEKAFSKTEIRNAKTWWGIK